MNSEDTIIRAADLAERIVDEVSEADQDWRTIEQYAQELAELTAQVVAQRATGPA
jgi:hypothetical protein